MNQVIKGQFYKGIIGKWPFHGYFPIISLVIMVKVFGSTVAQR